MASGAYTHAYTHTHTHTHTRIHLRMKVIIRNQARWPVAGSPGLKISIFFIADLGHLSQGGSLQKSIAEISVNYQTFS